MMNFDKMLIYFRSNVDSVDREVVGNLLGVRVFSSLEKNLSLSMMVGRCKKQAFAHYVD